MRGRLPAIIAVALVGCLTGCDGARYSTPYVQSLLEERRHDVVVQKWDLSCGAAALATLLTYDLGHPTTEHDIAAALLKRYQNIGQVQMQLGFSLLDLKAYAEKAGFKATGYGDMTLHDLVTMAPMIVPIHVNGFNHFVIFRQIRGSRVLVADPAFGNRTMQIDYFASVWRDHIGFRVVPLHSHPVTRWTQAKPQDFWATSDGNEPVAHSVLALEQRAAGKVEIADNQTPPPAPKPATAAVQAPPPVQEVAKADTALRRVTAAGDPNEPAPAAGHQTAIILQTLMARADRLEHQGDTDAAR
jgi:predicted double-glycine peptidase